MTTIKPTDNILKLVRNRYL